MRVKKRGLLTSHLLLGTKREGGCGWKPGPGAPFLPAPAQGLASKGNRTDTIVWAANFSLISVGFLGQF